MVYNRKRRSTKKYGRRAKRRRTMYKGRRWTNRRGRRVFKGVPKTIYPQRCTKRFTLAASDNVSAVAGNSITESFNCTPDKLSLNGLFGTTGSTAILLPGYAEYLLRYDYVRTKAVKLTAYVHNFSAGNDQVVEYIAQLGRNSNVPAISANDSIMARDGKVIVVPAADSGKSNVKKLTQYWRAGKRAWSDSGDQGMGEWQKTNSSTAAFGPLYTWGLYNSNVAGTTSCYVRFIIDFIVEFAERKNQSIADNEPQAAVVGGTSTGHGPPGPP